jgi:hypothetical protein
MIPNIDSTSSPIIDSTSSLIIADEDASSCTQSASSGDEWRWPENQLGLELVDQFRNYRVVALDEKGEIKHHEAFTKH